MPGSAVSRSLGLAACALAVASGAGAQAAGPAASLQAPHTVARPRDAKARSVWQERPLVLEAQLGAGAPYGLVGLGVDWSISPWIALSAGAGTNGAGLQLAAQGRLQLPLGKGPLAFAVDGGVSQGPYDPIDLCLWDCPPSLRWDPAWWANFALSVVSRFASGINVRTFAGLAVLLNLDDGRCTEECREPDGVVLGFFGIALGYAFKL